MAGVAFVRGPFGSDADGGRLQSLVDRQFRCEQLAARRRLLTSLLALLSAPVWAMALWPRLLEGPDRRFLLYLFGFLLALCCWAVIEEWRAIQRLQRRLAEVGDTGSPATIER